MTLSPLERAYADLGNDVTASGADRGLLGEIGATVASPFVGAGLSVFNLFNVEDWTGIRDFEQPEWATPRSVVGSIVGGVAQFAIPYWGLGRAVGALANAGRGGRYLQYLSGAKGGAVAKRVVEARKAGKISAGMARFLATTSAGAGRAAQKGAFVDFFVYEGMEGNLSSLIQSQPGLANPITEFLATDEDNSEIGNRFRNVLEGAALGGMFDTFFAMRRGRKAMGLAAKAGKSTDEQVSAYAKAADEALEFRGDLHNNELDAALKERANETFEFTDADGNTKTVTNAEIAEDIAEEVRATYDTVASDMADEVLDPESIKTRLGKKQDEYAKQRKLHDNRKKRMARAEKKRARGEELTDKELEQFARDEAKEEAYQQSEWSKPLNELRVNVADLSEQEFRTFGALTDELNLRQKLELEGQAGNVRKLSSEQREARRLTKTGATLNELLDAPDGAAMLYRSVEQLGEGIEKVVVKNEAFVAKAMDDYRALTGMTYGQFDRTITRWMDEDPQQIAKIASKAAAVRALTRQVAEDLVPKIKQLNELADPSLELAQQLAQRTKNFIQLFNYQTQIGSSFGRALQSINANVDPKKAKESFDKAFKIGKLDAIVAMTDETYDPTVVKTLLDDLVHLTGSGDPIANMVAIKKWAETSALGKFYQMTTEGFINSLLSAPTTHIVNFGSGVTMAFWDPFERMMGAAFERFLSTDGVRRKVASQVMRTEWKTVLNQLHDFRSVWGAVRQQGGSVWDTTSKFEGGRFSPTQYMVDNETSGAFKTMFSPLVSGLRTPSKAIGVEDAVLRTWTGRSRALAIMEVDAVAKGMDPEQALRNAHDMLDIIEGTRESLKEQVTVAKALRQAGQESAAASNPIYQVDRAKELLNFSDDQLDSMIRAQEEGIVAGKVATWTNETDGIFRGARDIGNTITQKYPVTRFFLPFISTPINIAQYGWDRSIGAVLGTANEGLQRSFRKLGLTETADVMQGMASISRDLASTNAAARASARTRMAWGIGFTATTVGLMSSVDEDGLPMLTGSGPADPDLRRSLQQAGWQPYSIKVGGRYISYQRLDPFASIIGMMVDAGTMIRDGQDDETRSGATNLLIAMAGSVAKNLTSKTYTQGLSDALDLLTDPDRNAERVVGAFVTPAIVPLSALGGAVSRTLDDEVRSINSVVDRMKTRIPGLSDSLPPRRDLLGKPIKIEANEWSLVNPFRISKVRDSVVDKELSRYAYGFSEPSTTRGGIDLLDEEYTVNRQPAYDRWLELYGTTKIRGMDVRQALRKEIKSARYQRLDPEEGPNGERTPRVDALNSIIRRYRTRAWNELLRENPLLKTHTEEASAVRAARRAGRSPLTL